MYLQYFHIYLWWLHFGHTPSSSSGVKLKPRTNRSTLWYFMRTFMLLRGFRYLKTELPPVWSIVWRTLRPLGGCYRHLFLKLNHQRYFQCTYLKDMLPKTVHILRHQPSGAPSRFKQALQEKLEIGYDVVIKTNGNRWIFTFNNRQKCSVILLCTSVITSSVSYYSQVLHLVWSASSNAYSSLHCFLTYKICYVM